MSIQDLVKTSTKNKPTQNINISDISSVDPVSDGLSSKIDGMLEKLVKSNPILGSFVKGAVGTAKQVVTHPIDTARNIVGGLVSAPETLLRTGVYGVDKAFGGISKEKYDQILADEEAGKNPTLSGVISGNKEMGHAIKLGEDKAYRKILGATGQTALDFALPETKILKGGSVAAKLAEGTAVGAGYGATNAMQSNEDNPDYVKNALEGAGAGLAFSGGATAIGKGAKKIFKGKEVPVEETKSEETNTPSNITETPIVVNKKKPNYDLYNEPYIPEKDLPVIKYGEKESSNFPTIDADTGEIIQPKNKSISDNTLPSIDSNTGKVTPAKVLSPKPQRLTKVESVTETTKPVDVSEVKTKETLLSKKLNKEVSGLTPVEYEVKHRDEYQAKAAAYEQTNPKEFWDIASGKKSTNDLSFDVGVYKYAVDKAKAENNIPRLQELMNSKKSTTISQALSMLGDRTVDEHSFENIVNSIIKQREENLKNGVKDDIKLKATTARASKIKTEGEAMLKSNREMKASELNNFFDSITC